MFSEAAGQVSSPQSPQNGEPVIQPLGPERSDLKIVMAQTMEKLIAEREQNGCVAFGKGDQRAVLLPYAVKEPFPLDPSLSAELAQKKVIPNSGIRTTYTVATVDGFKGIVGEGWAVRVSDGMVVYEGLKGHVRGFGDGVLEEAYEGAPPIGYFKEDGGFLVLPGFSHVKKITRDGEKWGNLAKFYLSDVTDPAMVEKSLSSQPDSKPQITPAQASMEAAKVIISAPPAPAAQ